MTSPWACIRLWMYAYTTSFHKRVLQMKYQLWDDVQFIFFSGRWACCGNEMSHLQKPSWFSQETKLWVRRLPRRVYLSVEKISCCWRVFCQTVGSFPFLDISETRIGVSHLTEEPSTSRKVSEASPFPHLPVSCSCQVLPWLVSSLCHHLSSFQRNFSTCLSF